LLIEALMTGTRPTLETKDLARQVDALKQGGAAFGFPRSIPWQGCSIGELRPLTRTDADSDLLLDKLGTWRNRHRTAFFTQFEASRDSTRLWLTTIVLDRSDRVMFLVSDEESRPIGQCGLRDIGPTGAEIDAVMRGERHGHPRLMALSVAILVHLVFEELGLGLVQARTFADNTRSIRLFADLGLNVTGREIFKPVSEGNVTKYEPAGESECPGGRPVVHMELRRENHGASGF
jgi:RimJ/RimL family protein N-acetyltransferase